MSIQQMLLGSGAAGEAYWLNSWGKDVTSGTLFWKHIDVDSAGNIYTWGHGRPIASGGDTTSYGMFAKWDSKGDNVYFRKIDAKLGDYPAQGIVVSGTKAYLAGHMGYSTTYPGSPMMAINLSDGTIDWQRYYTTDNSNENQIHTKSVDADSSGNLYWVTKRLSYGDDFIVYKTNSSGVLQWATKIERPSSSSYIDQMWRLKLDSSGNIYVGGIRNDTGGNGDTSGFLIKLNSSGTLQWSKELGSTGSYSIQQFYDIAIDSSANIYCVGTTRANTNSMHRGWVAKYNSSGTLQYQRTYGSGSNQDNSQSINQYQRNCAFYDGYLYSVGTNDLTGSNIHIIKLDPSDGSLEWQRYLKAWASGAASYFYGYQSTKMLAANDSLYICGMHDKGSSQYRGVLAKLPLTALDDDIGSGSTVWEVGTWTHPMTDTSFTDSSPSFSGSSLSSGSCDDSEGEDWEVTSSAESNFTEKEHHEIDA